VHYGLGPAVCSPLQRWHARVRERASVRETFAEFEAAVAAAGAGGGAQQRAVFAEGSGRTREYRDHRLEWMVKAGGISVVQAGLRDGTIRFSWPRPVPPQ
jgi:hypothetical protein